MKRADEYTVGDAFTEKDGAESGVVISVANDPRRSTLAYILVQLKDGNFSIYGCLRDGRCEPFLTRRIPAEVIKRFLFDAFIGGELGCTQPADGKVHRVPLETWAPLPTSGTLKTLKTGMTLEVSPAVQEAGPGTPFRPPSAGQVIWQETPDDSSPKLFLPEIDFP